MYNHYLDDNSFVLLDPEPQGPQPQNHQGQQHHGPGPGQGNQSQHRPSGPHPAGPPRPVQPMRSKNDLLKDVTGGLSQLLDGVLKHFSLENFDTGDILLVLIILFLYLEDGDNLELVITLGLLLLLGLDDGKKRTADLLPRRVQHRAVGQLKNAVGLVQGLTTSRALMAYTTSPPFSVSAEIRRPLFTDTQ